MERDPEIPRRATCYDTEGRPHRLKVRGPDETGALWCAPPRGFKFAFFESRSGDLGSVLVPVEVSNG